MHHRPAKPPLRENRAAVGNATGYNEEARSESAPPAAAERPIQTTQFREALQKPPCQAGWNKNVLFGFS